MGSRHRERQTKPQHPPKLTTLGLPLRALALRSFQARRVGGIGAAAIMFLVACGESKLPPIRYETEKALIGTDFAEPICESQLQDLDDHIRFVETMLEAPSDDKIEIYVFAEPPDDCIGLGCYYHDEDIIKTMWAAVDHEVVHAVEARFVDRPNVFWSEGVAGALEQRGTLVGESGVLENINQRDRRFLDYATAGHFARWLLEEHDPVDLKRLLAGDPVLDRPIEVLASDYEAQRPFAYPPWFPCDYPALPQVDDGLWAEEIAVSCDHPNGTAGENYRFSVVRSVELPAGTYELETIGGSGTRMVGCQMEAWALPPEPMVHGDLPNEVEHSQTAVGVLFPSGETHRISLTDGTYKAVVATVQEEEDVTVRLTRVE